MKSKIIVPILLIGVLFSLSACKNSSMDESENSEAPTTEETLQKLEEQKELLSELTSAGDPEKCGQLEDQGFKVQCEANILLRLAGENKDPSYCEDIEEAFKEDCLLVATELDPPDFIDTSQPLPQ